MLIAASLSCGHEIPTRHGRTVSAVGTTTHCPLCGHERTVMAEAPELGPPVDAFALNLRFHQANRDTKETSP